MASGNPLVVQGVINLAVAHIVWDATPALNVGPAHLGRGGIRLALRGQASRQIETLTGLVQSPQPYMMIDITINLLRTQILGNLYKIRMETNSLIGAGTVYGDTRIYGPYPILNASIQEIREQDYSGENPLVPVTVSGYYLTNNLMWSGEVNGLDPSGGFFGTGL
jgi:hypothetical protein